MDSLLPYSWSMARKSAEDEEKLPQTRSASVLAANIKALMAAHPELGSNPKLGKKTGLGSSAVSRLINGHNGTIETLDRIADAFQIDTWSLLVPGLDPKHPPTLQPLSAREAELYRRWREVAKEFIKEEQ